MTGRKYRFDALILANSPSIDRTYLSSVERSERNLPIDNIGRIAEGLGTEPWKLLKDD